MRKNGTKAQRIKWGRKGGKIGGLRRALSLSPERRQEIASMAAKARWDAPHRQRVTEILKRNGG